MRILQYRDEVSINNSHCKSASKHAEVQDMNEAGLLHHVPKPSPIIRFFHSFRLRMWRVLHPKDEERQQNSRHDDSQNGIGALPAGMIRSRSPNGREKQQARRVGIGQNSKRQTFMCVKPTADEVLGRHADRAGIADSAKHTVNGGKHMNIR